MSIPNAREKLSGSAAALFQRFGYVRVSIRDITSSVDIPKGAFYNHFKSKEVSGGTLNPWRLRRRNVEHPHSC